MYRPDHFRVDNLTQMHALMRERPFATLVSMGSEGLSATHLPTVLKDEGPDGVVECHLARANPHWKELAEGNKAERWADRAPNEPWYRVLGTAKDIHETR